MKAKPLPPLEVVVKELNYNPDTGVITWKKGRKGRRKQAGHLHKGHGYYTICIDGKSYVAHRIAWLLHYGEDPGEMVIDHIDRDKTNNKIDNLRKATHAQNTQNMRAAKGCTQLPSGRWFTQVRLKGGAFRRVYDTEAEAVAAYKENRLRLEEKHSA